MIIADCYFKTEAISMVSFEIARPFETSMGGIPSRIRVDMIGGSFFNINADRQEYDRVITLLRNKGL